MDRLTFDIWVLRVRQTISRIVVDNVDQWMDGCELALPWFGQLLVSLLLFAVLAVCNGFGLSYLATVLAAEGARLHHTQYLITTLLMVCLMVNFIFAIVQFVVAPFIRLFNDDIMLCSRDQFLSRIRWFFFWTVAAAIPALWR